MVPVRASLQKCLQIGQVFTYIPLSKHGRTPRSCDSIISQVTHTKIHWSRRYVIYCTKKSLSSFRCYRKCIQTLSCLVCSLIQHLVIIFFPSTSVRLRAAQAAQFEPYSGDVPKFSNNDEDVSRRFEDLCALILKHYSIPALAK